MSQIDPLYFEKGIVEIKDGLLCLTKLGAGYGISLISALTIVKGELQGYERFKDLEFCDLPKEIMQEHDDIMRINKKGLNFIQEYIENHPFNESVYNLALSLQNAVANTDKETYY